MWLLYTVGGLVLAFFLFVFMELMGFHLQRIVQSGSPALLFKSESLLDEYEQIDIERGRRMAELGLARWPIQNKHPFA